MRNFLILFLLSTSIIPSYSQKANEKGDRAKLVLHSMPTDTLMVNIKNAYPFGLNFDVASSYAAGKVWFFENGKRINRKSKEIKYLEFTDKQGKFRRYTYDSLLKMKNLSEVVISGKINLYLNIQLTGVLNSSRNAVRFLEKDGEIVALSGFNSQKKLREKLIDFMKDQPYLQEKLDNKNLEDEEVLSIIRKYNTLYK